MLCALLPASMSQHLSDLFPQGGLCGLSSQERVDAMRRIQEAADALNSQFAADCSSSGFQPTLVPECGDGVWCPIVDFDVTGADTTCPAGWVLDDAPRVGCTNPGSGGGCAQATFSTSSLEYSRVCGRVTGRASGTPNGFRVETNGATVVNGIPLAEGVTFTLPSTFEHIWTLGASFSSVPNGIACPSNENFGEDFDPATIAFAQDNHFCDLAPRSGDRQLWTGVCDDITGDADSLAACSFNDPPFFTATLASPTTNDIDANICVSGRTSDEIVFVESMSLFIQL